MTGYTVHTGSTVKFSGGWDRIFQGKQAGGKTPAKPGKKVPARAKQKTAKAAGKKSKRAK